MRIRSIKPEFFDSPSTADSSPWARLLYIAMWCMADDWGVGSANLKEMAAAAFPNDDQWTSKELPSLCKEVADNYGVLFYTHRGRPYFQIPTWDDHQVTQRRAKRRFPTHDDPESTPDQAIHELPCFGKEVPSRNKENASTEQGKGNRGKGTGEQLPPKPPTGGPNATNTPEAFDEFWAAYPRKVDKRTARKAWTAAIKRDNPDTIINAAADYAADPNREDSFTKYPATWLNADAWTNGPLPPRGQSWAQRESDSNMRLLQQAQHEPWALEA